jgi:TIR domain-containing protein
MSSLADLPELVGFFSYSRQDDKHSQGALSGLRTLIQSELRLQLGRDFRLWQDTAAISEGALWEDEINRAIAESVFFIPIVTPSSVGSPHCKFEFESFLKREAVLGRKDLIFPILYVTVDALETEAQWRQDDLLKIIGARQYLDWRMLRYYEYNLPEVRQKIGQFGQNIAKALRKQWVMPTPGRPPEEGKAGEQREAGAGAHAEGQVADQHRDAETADNARTEEPDKKPPEPRQGAAEDSHQDGSAQRPAAQEPVAAVKGQQRGVPPRTAIIVAGVIAAAFVGAFAMWKGKPSAESQPAPIERTPVVAPTPAPTPAPSPEFARQPSPPPLLLNSSLGRWAVGEQSNCQVRSKFYTLSSSGGNIVWRSGSGNVDTEAIVSSDESEFRTRTVSSIHQSGSGEAVGTSWTYTRIGADRIQVTPGGRNSFVLARCS